ncbi:MULTISPECIES: LysR family transcriptional regulator [unclassified Rhodococcus (in: high G+C Gram-positive bacteria)]|uniref:LysR family transcriptional regulator n=1 Tax=unclassified Rhodococcus (in: high G+C Gram-positive bacteria) TaxID=192944 RepID=UPI0015C64C06|nr:MULTISPECIES: LysR family transcriptional regulator [unclassified Rhodococcus (in: high G+C Gram-positive bacteria)]
MEGAAENVAHRVNIRTVRFALTLAEELHFGRAAQRHYIAAQPFGRIIQGLESDLGYRLFDRTSRRVSLTPRGLVFLDRAQQVVDAFDRLILSHPIGTSAEHLTFGVLGFGISTLWADFKDGLSAAIPDLAISFADLTLSEQYDAVLSGAVDVGFVQELGLVDGIDLIPVTAGPRVAVVPKQSEMAGATWLSVADIAESEFVDLDTGGLLEEWAGPAWVNGRRGDRVRYPAAIPSAVALTGRIALHAAPAASYYPHPQVSFVPLEGPDCTIAVAVRSNDRRPETDLIRRIAGALLST